jgi:hypothetical protein
MAKSEGHAAPRCADRAQELARIKSPAEAGPELMRAARDRDPQGWRISVVVGIRTDIHPSIVGVENDAGVRVIPRIVVGIARRETQTHACYEWIPKAKASAPEAWRKRGGAKAWSERGGAEPWRVFVICPP